MKGTSSIPYLCVVFMLVSPTTCYDPFFDWCQLRCPEYQPPGDMHTMCRFPAGGGSECTKWKNGVSDDEKMLILDYHNLLRQKIANGQEPGYPLPQAANMNRLIWDEELAAVAQRWAEQCQYGAHDTCRVTQDNQYVGQNVAECSGMTVGGGPLPDLNDLRKTEIKLMVQGWYDEIQNFDMININVANPGPMDGHFTQVIWAETLRLGCGVSQLEASSQNTYKHSLDYQIKLVCNYEPGGNMLGDPIYQRGAPTSQCPYNMYPSTTFPGLCESADEGAVPDHQPTVQLVNVGERDEIRKKKLQSKPVVMQFTGPDMQFGNSVDFDPQPLSGPLNPKVMQFGSPQEIIDHIRGQMQQDINSFPQPAALTSQNLQPSADVFSQLPPPPPPATQSALPTPAPISTQASASVTVISRPTQAADGGAIQTAPPPKKKESFFWKVITFPFRVIKFIFMIPVHIFNFSFGSSLP